VVDEELESWIEDRLAEGYDPAQIEQRLKEEGWDDESIEEAEQMARQKVQQQQSPQPQNDGFQQDEAGATDEMQEVGQQNQGQQQPMDQQQDLGQGSDENQMQEMGQESMDQGDPEPGQKFGEPQDQGFNQMQDDQTDNQGIGQEGGFSDDSTGQDGMDNQSIGNTDPSNMEYASIGQRILAYIADGFILSIILTIIGIGGLLATGGTAMLTGGSEAAVSSLGIGLILIYAAGMVLPILYFIGLPARNGKTLGKKLLGIKIVKEDGSPIGVKASAIRYLLLMVDMLPTLFIVGFYYMKNSDRNQRLGDKVAGTVVIQE
jgi:uncharacterized RDD family membrane protein YckC